MRELDMQEIDYEHRMRVELQPGGQLDAGEPDCMVIMQLPIDWCAWDDQNALMLELLKYNGVTLDPSFVRKVEIFE